MEDDESLQVSVKVRSPTFVADRPTTDEVDADTNVELAEATGALAPAALMAEIRMSYLDAVCNPDTWIVVEVVVV